MAATSPPSRIPFEAPSPPGTLVRMSQVALVHWDAEHQYGDYQIDLSRALTAEELLSLVLTYPDGLLDADTVVGAICVNVGPDSGYTYTTSRLFVMSNGALAQAALGMWRWSDPYQADPPLRFPPFFDLTQTGIIIDAR